MNIYKNILETVGNTPLVRLNKINKGLDPEIIVKLESFNPCGSLKDRIGYAMLNRAKEEGKLNSNSHIVEATSGNTGIGLAMACAVYGYKLSLVMPSNMSKERIDILKLFGAEIILTEPELGMTGSLNKVDELKKKNKNIFVPNQFNNLSNPEIHKETTAKEILRDTDGELSAFVCGIGTGGSITGVGELLKEKSPKIKIIGVEPSESPILSGGNPGPHKIQGLGAGFIPSIINLKIIDEIITVKFNDAFKLMKDLAKLEGIMAGISSGAVVWAALEIAENFSKNDRIVCLLGDTGERYLSTYF